MKKIGLICLAIVLALAGLGLGYAHWGQNLYIDTAVDAGSFGAGFVEVTVAEKYIDPDTKVKMDGEWLGKDVGNVTYEYVDLIEDVHTLKSGYRGVEVTVSNGYPSYQAHIIFLIENLGTIPLVIEGITVTDPTNVLTYDEGEDCLYEDANANDVKDADEPCIINFEVHNLIGVQLDYCETDKAEVDIHIKQDAEPCHTYYFYVEIETIQWNKSIYWPVPPTP